MKAGQLGFIHGFDAWAYRSFEELRENPDLTQPRCHLRINEPVIFVEDDHDPRCYSPFIVVIAAGVGICAITSRVVRWV